MDTKAKDVLRDIILNAEAIARESRDLLTDKNYAPFLQGERAEPLIMQEWLDLRDRIERISSELNTLYCRIDEKAESTSPQG